MEKLKKDMKRTLRETREWFESNVVNRDIILTLNGFTACGILKKPRKHLDDERSNTMWLYTCGSGKDINEFEEQINLYMSLEELMDLQRVIGKAIQTANELGIKCDYEKPKTLEESKGEKWHW
jgi:hypothetical protein